MTQLTGPQPDVSPAVTEPVLLGPQRLAVVAGSSVVLVAAGLLAAFLTLPGGDSSTRPDDREAGRGGPAVVTLAAGQTTGAFTQLQQPFQDSPGSVLAQLELQPDEKEQVRQRLQDRTLRLAMVRLWDTHDEDGDEVELISAGFTQRVLIRHHEQIFFLPIQPGGIVRIRAVRDGRGGVTLGVATASGRMPLPVLAVGQILELPAL